MSLAIPLLGMHRSGTSCLSRVLHAAGVHMGDDLMLTPYSNNMLGDWEPIGVMHLNDSILSQSGGAWNFVPDHLQADEETLQSIREMIARFSEHPIFGWKDPRTTITFGCWRKFLPQYRIVAAYRHPYSVANSLVARRDGTFEEGVALWLKYNEQLLEYTAHEEQVDWFPYDAPLEETEVRLKQFCAGTGLTYRPELLELINPFLRHQATYSPDDIKEPRIREIYDELHQRARLPEQLAGSTPIQTANEMPSGSNPPQAPLNELRRQLSQLGETVKAMHTIQQRQMLDQNALSLECQNLSETVSQAQPEHDRHHESLNQSWENLTAEMQRQQACNEVAAEQISSLSSTQKMIISHQELLQLSMQDQRQQLLEMAARLESFEKQNRIAIQFVTNLRGSWPFRLNRKISDIMHSLWRRNSPPAPPTDSGNPAEKHCITFPNTQHALQPPQLANDPATPLDAAG